MVFNRPDPSHRRRELRNNQTPAELTLWDQLKGGKLNGVKFRRQFGVGPFIVDFYAPKLRLVIEVDGDSHFSPEGKQYDLERTAYLNGLGLMVIRFTNMDVKQALEDVLRRIRQSMPPSPYETEA